MSTPTSSSSGLVLAAQQWPTNSDLIVDVARLGYLQTDWRVLDPTFHAGTWWRTWRPTEGQLVTRCRDLDGSDFRDLSEFPDGHFDAIAFDPPYAAQGSKTTTTMPDYNARYGRDVVKSDASAVQHLMNDGLTEMWRLIRPDGIVLMKCQDYVWSGDLHLGTHWTLTHAIALGFIVEERFEMYALSPSPQPKRSRCLRCGAKIQRRRDHETWTDMTRTSEPSTVCRRPAPFLPHRPDPSTPSQDHAARNLSTLFVFRKPVNGRRPKQYPPT